MVHTCPALRAWGPSCMRRGFKRPAHDGYSHTGHFLGTAWAVAVGSWHGHRRSSLYIKELRASSAVYRL